MWTIKFVYQFDVDSILLGVSKKRNVIFAIPQYHFKSENIACMDDMYVLEKVE
jgi:hypothetical protein